MARFSGVVGFVTTLRTAPGVSTEVAVEKGPYRGNITRESISPLTGETLNGDLTTNNNIEIVADAYASDNFSSIRYVKWAGAYWKVVEATVQRPRLLLRLGGVYNGTRAPQVPAPEAP